MTRRLGQATFYAAAFSVGIGGSALWPWGWAPAPMPDETPRPGFVLTVGADSALVPTGAVLHMDDGSRIGVVLWLRGKAGRDVWRVTGCEDRRGIVAPLDRPEDRTAWQDGDSSMVARLALAVCFNEGPKAAAKETI